MSGPESSEKHVLCYNLPPMEEQYLTALKRHLGTDDITVEEKGLDDGDVVTLLQGPLAHCKVVEIDRTDKEHEGLDGLQEARKSTALQVQVIAFGTQGYKNVSEDVDLERAESSAVRMEHC